jgi:transposase InsO family protein
MYIDIFSRKILGWEINENEREEIAINLFLRILEQERISGVDLRVHNDNGSSMRGSMFVDKLKSLGVIHSCSRPSVSNDNPYAESLFKTMKYRPQYPYGPFATIDDAKAWVESFVSWYNEEHLHSAIAYVTPSHRHRGDDVEILAKRRQAFRAAHQLHPSRWIGKVFNWDRVETVELNAAGCREVK